jgi:hypothetical protein
MCCSFGGGAMTESELLALIRMEYEFVFQLGFHHSLADGDFRDLNNCFPEDYLAHSSCNGSVDFYEACVPEVWTPDEIEALHNQVFNQVLVFKGQVWVDVNPGYLRRYSSGLLFIEEYSTNYYFAAWAWRYIRGEISSSDSISMSMFYLLGMSLTESADLNERLLVKFDLFEKLMLWVLENDIGGAAEANKVLKLLRQKY